MEEPAIGARTKSEMVSETFAVDMGVGFAEAKLLYRIVGCSVCFSETHFAPISVLADMVHLDLGRASGHGTVSFERCVELDFGRHMTMMWNVSARSWSLREVSA